MKKIYFSFFCFLFIFTLNKQSVLASSYIDDSSSIFNETDLTLLNENLIEFENRTNITPYIKTVFSINESVQIDAEKFYNIKFQNSPDYFLIYLVKDTGDLIMMNNNELISDDTISLMMMSLESEFSLGNIEKGLSAALFNGILLIEEQMEANIDKHEIYEVPEKNNSSEYYFMIFSGGFLIVITLIFIKIYIIDKIRKAKK